MGRDNGSAPDNGGGEARADGGGHPDVADRRAAGRIVPVKAGNVRWERPTRRSFWNALADPERDALAAAGMEEIFRPGVVLCREGDESSQVMIIDSGWVKVSVRQEPDTREKILAVRGPGDVVGEQAALTTRVRSATVTALDEVSAMVVTAEQFAEFLRSYPRAAEVLERQVADRRKENRARLFPGDRDGAEGRLAWLLLDLARRRGGYAQTSTAVFTLPMSQQELADWVGTSADAVGRFLRSWRERGIIRRNERARRVTVIDLDGLAALCGAGAQSANGHGPGPAASGIPPSAANGVAPPEPAGLGVPGLWPGTSGDPLNCTILMTDVAGFGDPQRNDGDRNAIRTALYEIMRSAFDASGVPWGGCYREDRGDGIIIVVPPTVATVRLVEPLIAELAGRLRQYNRRASEVARIQLRSALHVGPVGKDTEGLTGQAVIGVARILDAPVIKERLAAERADLIFAVSDWVYEYVIRNGDGRVDPASFDFVEGQVKETRVAAWVHLAGQAAIPPPAAPPAPLPVEPPLGNLPADVRGRDGLLAELRRSLRPYPWRASRAFVIAGMGGLGKSTVALAAAKMAKERGYRVWWVNAADSALVTSGMLEVLRELGAPESVTAPVREGARAAPARAWEFLNGEHLGGRRWLLVFDGADNPAVLAGGEVATPANGTGWLRPDPAGMVIVTTRTRDPHVWGSRVTLRELKPLDEEASAEVLRDLAPELADPDGIEARALSRRLGGLPLALHLAGAYLGSPFARWTSFAEYHEALDSVELPEALADIEGPGADSRQNVQRTWDLSLDALAADGLPQARSLLLVLSCYAPATPIPARLMSPEPLAALFGPRPENPDKEAERRELRAAVHGLSRTGLIEVSGASGPAGLNAITVHPVVADANRSRLATVSAAERADIQQTVVALLEAGTAPLDPTRPADWPAWRLLVPHLIAAIELLAGHLDAKLLSRLLTVAAQGTEALLAGGRLVAAGRLTQASVTAAGHLGRDDPAAMTARGCRARTLVRQGRSAEAETAYTELLADRRRVQGDDHPDTLAIRHDLAAAIGLQGRYAEAERLYRQLIADDYRLLGADQRQTLAARYSLARMIGLQGRYAEAEQMGREVLADQRALLGDEHPDCLASRQHLARIADRAGRYKDAERMYRQVLADRRRVLGDDHPDTLSTRHNLARMIGLQGRYAEAEDLCHQVLDDRRRLLGEDHPHNMSTAHRLARMLSLQGRYADAESLFLEVLAARRQRLGDDHPETMDTRHRLAWLRGRQGRYTEAVEIIGQVLGGRRQLLGDDHPDTLAARETLAWLTGLRKKLPEADELCHAVLAARRRVLGDDHPDTLATRSTLAWLAELNGRYAEAERQYRQLVDDRSRVLGAGHPDTLSSQQDLARATGRLHRDAEAEQLTRDVLAARRRVLGDDHPDTLASRAILAGLAADQHRGGEAEELYRQVLADRSRVLGATHPDTEATRNDLARLVAGGLPHP